MNYKYKVLKTDMLSLHRIFDLLANVKSYFFLNVLLLFNIMTLRTCDTSDINLSSGTVNISNSFISNSKTNSKLGIDILQSTLANDDIRISQQIPLVRLPSNTLLKYTAYKDVSIQHFFMPMDTRSAIFSFKSYEESKSALSE